MIRHITSRAVFSARRAAPQRDPATRGDGRPLSVTAPVPVLSGHFAVTMSTSGPGAPAVMAISGEVDGCTVARLRQVSSRAGDITVDLSRVSFLGCAGLTVLLELRSRLLDSGSTLRLVGLTPLVNRVIGLAGLGELLFESAEDGRAATPIEDDDRPRAAWRKRVLGA
ncbi:STAS domain-containing protein [Actinokineospora guangxiensis]